MNTTDKKPKTDLARKLQVLRAQNDYTQKFVADKLGISQQTYSKYEAMNSAIDSNVIMKLCALYDISADDLLGIKRPERVNEIKAETKIYDDIDLIVERVLERMKERNL